MKVYLVGAGPGDVGLITVRGLELLREAEVIIYDALVNPRLLQEAKAEAILIDVGKRCGRHSADQSEINALLLKWGGRGLNVVRLKGGDPFMFGRGGEEMLALQKAGLAFEIVPGVSSALAAPAYAGIALTRRDLASSVTFIAGHEAAKEQSAHTWHAYAELGRSGTLVFLMGMYNLAEICEHLQAEGLPPNTPAAVVQWGTCAGQRKAVGTVANLPGLAAQQGLGAPAIIVVGQVAALGEALSWFEQKPLFGRRVVVTRARSQASQLSALLQNQGAEVLEFPCLAIRPPQDCTAIAHTINRLGRYNWLLFTSPNGVEQFFKHLENSGQDARALGQVKFGVIGPGTAQALAARGFKADFMPTEYRAEALAAGLVGYVQKQASTSSCGNAKQKGPAENTPEESGLGEKVLAGQRILIPRAADARNVLESELARHGAEVEVLSIYETVLPANDSRLQAAREELLSTLAAGQIDCISFASSSAVENFCSQISPAELLAAQSAQKICLAAIGPITASALQKHGLACTVQPQNYTIEALAQSIGTFFKSKKAQTAPEI